MSQEKKGILKKIFMVIGIIVTIIILLLLITFGILAIVKPYGFDVIKAVPALLDNPETSSYDHPYLSTKQEILLESAGIDLKTLPTEVTPSQQECSIEALGLERATAIASGSTPSVSEIIKAKHCFE